MAGMVALCFQLCFDDGACFSSGFQLFSIMRVGLGSPRVSIVFQHPPPVKAIETRDSVQAIKTPSYMPQTQGLGFVR